ncbi:MAG: glucose transporter GlcU [Paenibacillaceae bacterium]|nr:glucose transporter GlcU [Paenibacillaceae bacterium]
MVMTKIGGKPSNQQMGMVMGALLFAIVVFIFKRPEEWTPNLIISCILCGLIWSFGQLDMKKGVITLLMSSAALVCYAVIPRVAGISGWDALFPQAIAMFAGTIFLYKLEKGSHIWSKKSFQNILTGFAFAIANLTMMLSNERNGVAVGYTLSQMNVIVATIGGLLILRETKTRLELKYVLGGLLLVACGGIAIGLTKL